MCSLDVWRWYAVYTARYKWSRIPANVIVTAAWHVSVYNLYRTWKQIMMHIWEIPVSDTYKQNQAVIHRVLAIETNLLSILPLMLRCAMYQTCKHIQKEYIEFFLFSGCKNHNRSRKAVIFGCFSSMWHKNRIAPEVAKRIGNRGLRFFFVANVGLTAVSLKGWASLAIKKSRLVPAIRIPISWQIFMGSLWIKQNWYDFIPKTQIHPGRFYLRPKSWMIPEPEGSMK